MANRISSSNGFSKAELLRQALWTVFAGLLSYTYNLIDKSFLIKISSDYLQLEVWIGYLVILFVLVGRSVGHSLLVLLKKASSEAEAIKYLSGAILVSLYFGFALLVIFCLSMAFYLKYFGLLQISGALPCSLALIFAALLRIVPIICKFALLAKQKQRFIFYAECFGISLNILGDFISVTFFDSPSSKAIGIFVTTCLIQIALTIYYLKVMQFHLQLGFESVRVFWKRAKHFVIAEYLHMFAAAMLPFFYALILRNIVPTEQFLAFNIALSLSGWTGVIFLV